MTNFGNIFVDEIINWLIYEAGVKQSKCQISIYYKYELYGSKLGVLSYAYQFLYFYTYE